MRAGGGGRRIYCWPLSQNSSFRLLTHPPCPRGSRLWSPPRAGSGLGPLRTLLDLAPTLQSSVLGLGWGPGHDHPSFYLGQKGWQKSDLYSRKKLFSLDLEFLVLETRPFLFHSPPLTGISWGAGTRGW